MLKILKELLTKLLLPLDSKINTKTLEKNKKLVDLSSAQFEERPTSPYGNHLKSISIDIERFENGTLVSILRDDNAVHSTFISEVSLDGEKEER